MRHFLISALLLSLVAGCSSFNVGPHRIDVQQGNALDQENVSRLKTGLNRSQVRFLLGTPLLVDPFRNDRWDYVYVDYKAGKLAEQKRISLFFDGDTLTRIEGDLPAAVPTPEPSAPVVKPESKVETMALPLAAESGPTPEPLAASTEPIMASAPVKAATAASGGLSLHAESDAEKLKPDVMPSTSNVKPVVGANDAPVLSAMNSWANAWSRRDDEAYIASYDASFVPEGGDSHAEWEKRRRLLLNVAKNIELKISSPSVSWAGDGSATVTFNQFYRSENYRDAVVKQLRMIQSNGRWLIVEEKVLSILSNDKP